MLRCDLQSDVIVLSTSRLAGRDRCRGYLLPSTTLIFRLGLSNSTALTSPPPTSFSVNIEFQNQNLAIRQLIGQKIRSTSSKDMNVMSVLLDSQEFDEYSGVFYLYRQRLPDFTVPSFVDLGADLSKDY